MEGMPTDRLVKSWHLLVLCLDGKGGAHSISRTASFGFQLFFGSVSTENETIRECKMAPKTNGQRIWFFFLNISHKPGILYAEVRLRAIHTGGCWEKRNGPVQPVCFVVIVLLFSFFFLLLILSLSLSGVVSWCVFTALLCLLFLSLSLSHFQSWYDRWGATAGHRRHLSRRTTRTVWSHLSGGLS